jgi:hypothetical protein
MRVLKLKSLFNDLMKKYKAKIRNDNPNESVRIRLLYCEK